MPFCLFEYSNNQSEYSTIFWVHFNIMVGIKKVAFSIRSTCTRLFLFFKGLILKPLYIYVRHVNL